MITSFYFDQDLFDDESVQKIPLMTDSILETWEKCGCLAICNSNRTEIRAALTKVDMSLRKKWVEALSSQSYKKNIVSLKKNKLCDLNGIEEFENLFYSELIITGLLTSEYEELYKIQNLSVGDVELEVITPKKFSESRNFNKSKDACLTSIKAGTDINEIWEERLSKLIYYSSRITIIDRYLASNLLEDIENGKETSLEFIFEKLSRFNRNYTVVVYSACDIPQKDVNATKIRDYLNNVLTKKPYYKSSNDIQFSLCKNNLFGNEAHDRLVCIDEHVVEIGKGLDIFRKGDIKNNTFTIKPKRFSFFRECYNKLSKNREWNYVKPS